MSRLPELLAAFGFAEYHTGGGCWAMLRAMGERGDLMITDADSGLPCGGDWILGHYDSDGQPLRYRQGRGDGPLAEAIFQFLEAPELAAEPLFPKPEAGDGS